MQVQDDLGLDEQIELPSSWTQWRERVNLIAGLMGFALAMIALHVASPSIWALGSVVGLVLMIGGFEVYARRHLSSLSLPAATEPDLWSCPLFIASCVLLLAIAVA